MARRVFTTTGAWSTASNWEYVTNTPTMHASNNATISTTPSYTATFAAVSTSDFCTGMIICITSISSFSGTITVTLQEYDGISTWSDTTATVTINKTNYQYTVRGATIGSLWVNFRFSSPYQFTTTSAGRYRFKILCSTGNFSVGTDSGGTLPVFLATDNRASVSPAVIPASTDQVWIIGQNGSATNIACTIDGTQLCGDDTAVATSSARSVGYGLYVGFNGTLDWDTAASSSLTVKGSVFLNPSSKFYLGKVGATVPAGQTAKLLFDCSTATQRHFFYGYSPVDFQIQGEVKPYWKTTKVSGTGTAADPLITTADIGQVGDELVFEPTDGYAQTEYRFIKTRNSATSYVLSTTKGGTEAALTYTHDAGSYILNIERNAIVSSTDSTKSYPFLLYYSSNTNIDWGRFEYSGGSIGSSGYGVSLGTASVSDQDLSIDYSVVYQPLGSSGNYGLQVYQYKKSSKTHTGLICTQTANVAGNLLVITAKGREFIDCFVFGGYYAGIYINSCVAATLTRCVSSGSQKGNPINSGGIVFNNSYLCNFNNCEVHCSRRNEVGFIGSCYGIKFKDCLFGTRGSVGTVGDVYLYDEFFEDVLFDNCTFTHATLLSGYSLLTDGSEVKFRKHNTTANNHFWYTPYGVLRSTGAGLIDTTVRTAGGLALRVGIESSDSPTYWQQYCPVGNIQNKTMTVAVWVYINNANYYGGSTYTLPTLTVDYDNGTTISAVASATAGSWQLLTVTFTPSTTYPEISITISGLTDATGSNAYFYVDDMSVLFPAGTVLNLGTLDTWSRAKPSVPSISTTISAADVWSVATAGLTGAGTTGKLLVDTEVKVDDAAVLRGVM